MKNNTLIETPEDVSGLLGLCLVLVKDVKEGNLGGGPPVRQRVREGPEMRELAEEQGWVARMVHLFRNEDLGVQFEVSMIFASGGRGKWLTWYSYSRLHGNTSQKAETGSDSLSLPLSLLEFSSLDDSKQEKEK